MAKVYLIGAGCHDASWLSVKAAQILSQADVVIHDALIDSSLLDLCPHAQIHACGKRGGKVSVPQEEINALLVESARKHNVVVRLKGGDPLVFGRAAEEMETLQVFGIDYEIIPGISSITGIAAKEGFGLSERGKSRGFLVVTASTAGSGRSEQEWQSIADFEGTRVFLMGMKQIKALTQCLMAHGVHPETDCAVLTSPVMTATQSVYAPLNALAKQAEAAGLKSPGVILVGGSVPSAPPRQLKRVGFVTTPAFAARIEKHLPGTVQAIQALRTKTQPIFHDWKTLLHTPPAWIVLTSRTGVDLLFEAFQEQQVDIRRLAAVRFACIGAETARALREHGLIADLVPTHAASADLANALSMQLQQNEVVWLCQSVQANPVLNEQLSKRAQVLSLPVYSLQMLLREAICPDVLVFGSRLCAETWLAAHSQPVDVPIAAISKNVADLLAQATTASVAWPEQPDAADMARVIERLLIQNNGPDR